jgi:hypothetical protein
VRSCPALFILFPFRQNLRKGDCEVWRGNRGPTKSPTISQPNFAIPMNFESYVASIYFKIRNGFASLKGSPPELYTAFWLKFLDSYSYFSFSIIFTLFLSSDFGFSDVQAGTFYGLWGGMITVRNNGPLTLHIASY